MNRKSAVFVAALVLGSWLAFSERAAAAEFTPGCTLPFAAALPSDYEDPNAECPAEGQASAAPHRAQNRAKNNLCASGAPVTLNRQTFLALQRRADQLKDQGKINFGSSNALPEDRAELREVYKVANGPRVGEGTVVRYVAFINNPRYSNVRPRGKGESVNCKLLEEENNDIHIDLGREPGEIACQSITAEVIPHLRPPAWGREYLLQVRLRPMRVTGQLFFDASHIPCRNDSDRVAPKRASLWEIHPVYAIDVCRRNTLSACAATNESL